MKAAVPAPAEDSEVMNLLAELKGDITHMKAATPSGEDSEVMSLLAELKGDITHMKAATPAEDSEVMNLLAELKGDITHMKAETGQNDEVGELLSMVSQLRGDLVSMKEQVAEATTSKPKAGIIDAATDDPLIMTVNAMLETGDVLPARKVLEYAVEQGNPDAQFKLAETYDPARLALLVNNTEGRTRYRPCQGVLLHGSLTRIYGGNHKVVQDGVTPVHKRRNPYGSRGSCIASGSLLSAGRGKDCFIHQD